MCTEKVLSGSFKGQLCLLCNLMLRAPTEDLELFKERDFSFRVEGGKTHPKNTVLNCDNQQQILSDCTEADMS